MTTSCSDTPGLRWRLACYALMGVVSPGILLTFVLLFGSDSYQYWADRYHIDLTNKYLFSGLADDSVLGPLWRDDTLAGNPWIVSLVSSPLSVDVLAARLLHLSPVGIELVGTLALYFLAVGSMYGYLRQVLQLSREASAASAVIFACAAYWDYSLNTNPNVPMAVAWLPALLTMAHRINDNTGRRAGTLLPSIGLALLFFVCAMHSTLATLPVTLLFVATYAVVVFELRASLIWTALALGVGLLLYSPFLWLFIEAAALSHRNLGTGFFPEATLGMQQWLAQGKSMVSQVLLGVNRYGIYLVVVLGILLWFCVGRRAAMDQPRLRKIVLFAAVASLAIFTVELFHEAINHVKRTVPLLRGWNVLRFADFGSFGFVTLAAWMFDRSLFLGDQADLTPTKRTAIRRAIVATGLLGGVQIAFYAYRMREVPGEIFPQNLVLCGYLFAYASVLLVLLVLLYRRTGRRSFAVNGDGTYSGRLVCATLIVAAVSLVTSLHAYRSGLVKPQGVEVKADAAPIMTYAERYTVPDEVLSMKRLVVGDGRVLDLTRPLNAGTWLVGSEITMLPLVGLRVLSGYSNLYPAWYGMLIHAGINGASERLWNIVQVEDTGRANLQALPLLDVRYVLAKQGSFLRHYTAVAEFKSSGKTLYTLEQQSRLGPAFVSTDFRCFASDDEALRAIHEADLSTLRSRAILSAGDPASFPLCTGQIRLPAISGESLPLIRSDRATDRVSIQVERSPGGILTLSDTYYPGWKVFVNGEEKPLLRTYAALRGVLIEPGRQSVEFVYAPQVFRFLSRMSAWTGVSLLLIGAGLWVRERRWVMSRAGSP